MRKKLNLLTSHEDRVLFQKRILFIRAFIIIISLISVIFFVLLLSFTYINNRVLQTQFQEKEKIIRQSQSTIQKRKKT